MSSKAERLEAKKVRKRLKELRRSRRWTKDDTEITILALPTFIWYILFCYIPLIGLIIAFKNFTIKPGNGFFTNLFTSEWTLGNFGFIFKSNDFLMLLRNTILYNIVFIVLGIVVPITIAIMLSLLRQQRAAKLYQTMMFFPYFLSWLVVAFFVYAWISPDKGIINTLKHQFNPNATPTMFYSWPQFWVGFIPFLNLWKGIGYGSVLYLAAITGIDFSMYEAATIDGASRWAQIRYITLPMLKPVVIMLFILNVGRIFYSDYGLFFQVTKGNPLPIFSVTSTFDTYMIGLLRSVPNIGLAAAPGFLQSIACCITILLTNWLIRRIDPDNALI